MTSEVLEVQGRGLPLKGNDIDTDRIIPARFLRCVTFDGLGAQVFRDDRTQLQGTHPFDQPAFQGATILLVNANFGCGSSREHAPQALMKWGIRALIGESFAEIFFGNCLALGIPCVTVSSEEIQALQAAVTTDPQLSLSLNLKTLTLQSGSATTSVQLATGPQQMLLTGTWDACGQLLANQDQIHQVAAGLPYLSWARV